MKTTTVTIEDNSDDATDYDAPIDELPDLTTEELEAAADEFFDSIHLAAPVTALLEETPDE